MPTIIKNDTELRKYIPNVLATVEGEPSIFDRLSPFLESAEFWVSSNFAPQSIMYVQATSHGEQQTLIKQLIVYHAFMLAVPSLDLVLTPNGFGIVNNSNVAPASKERVERLLAHLEAQRDTAIEHYLYVVYTFSSYWEHEPQGLYFMATLFPNLDLCDLCGITAHRWNEYQQLRQQILVIERELENKFFSREQMATFRKSVMNWRYYKPDTLYTKVIEAIRNLEVSLLTGLQPHPQQFRDIVNIMRNSPNYFSDWANSDTAKLFAPELFINKKSSAGYWF